MLIKTGRLFHLPVFRVVHLIAMGEKMGSGRGLEQVTGWASRYRASAKAPDLYGPKPLPEPHKGDISKIHISVKETKVGESSHIERSDRLTLVSFSPSGSYTPFEESHFTGFPDIHNGEIREGSASPKTCKPPPLTKQSGQV